MCLGSQPRMWPPSGSKLRTPLQRPVPARLNPYITCHPVDRVSLLRRSAQPSHAADAPHADAPHARSTTAFPALYWHRCLLHFFMATPGNRATSWARPQNQTPFRPRKGSPCFRCGSVGQNKLATRLVAPGPSASSSASSSAATNFGP